MTVDLNRLREATRYVSVTDAEQDCLRETGQAVLDAPTVYLCNCDIWLHPPPVTASKAPNDCEAIEGCGYVNLVPVKGES